MAETTGFFAEQDKRRAHVWRFSALSFFLLLIAGLPLAMVVTPIIFVLLAVVARVFDLLLPIPAEFWDGLRAAPGAVMGNQGIAGWVLAGAVLIGPGIGVIAWVWWRLRRGLEQAGATWMVAALGGREPRRGDFEETQIINLSEEMALAAGVPAPPVFVVDEPFPNAAVVGPDEQQAAFIVTRGLLDGFDRNSTQAIIGYLMAGVRQGSLQAATAVITAFHAFGLVLLVFDACVNLSRRSWADLRRVLAWLARPQHLAADTQEILALLERSDPPEDGLTGLQSDLTSDEPARTRAVALVRKLPVLYFLLLPALLVYIVFIFIRFELFLLRAFLIGPVLVLAWRQRVHLADAATVQFTRNPQALADALQGFQGLESVGLDSRWLAAYCFVGAEPGAVGSQLAEEPGALPAHPARVSRLRRIGAMGAAVDVGAASRLRLPTWAELRQTPWWGLLLIPLILLIGYLLLAVIGMVLGLATLFSLFFVAMLLSLIGGVMP